MAEIQEEEKQLETQEIDEGEMPTWKRLSEIFETDDPFFNSILFLQGYDFSSNSYAIEGDYITIIDPGNDYTAFIQLFEKGIKPLDIKKIVITHGHRDHVMGTFELFRYSDIMQNRDIQVILHEEGPFEFKEMIKKIEFPYTEIRGGETIEVSGFQLEAIHTPGHTIDGVTYYHAPTKTAFTGDTVLPHAMAEPDKNAGGNFNYYLYGVKALLKKDIENILPGHGMPVKSLGRTVIEQTYESLMMKVIGVEKKIRWVDGAMHLVQKGLLEEAVFCCDKALAFDSNNLQAVQLKAFCLTDLDKCEEALPLFDRLIDAKKDDPGILIGKGRALMGVGKYLESIEYFDKVLEFHPNVKDAQVLKGMALYLSGRFEEALEIEGFKEEFIGRFRETLEKRAK